MSFSQSEQLEHRLTIPDYTGSAKELLNIISEEEEIVFAYSSAVLLSYEVSLQKQQISLQEFLDTIFEGRPIDYKIKKNKVLLFPREELPSQPGQLSQTIRGTVIDNDNKRPLVGVTVLIPGTEPIIGTITDLSGRFRLENRPIGRTNLQFSYMGYESHIVPNIEVNSGKEVVLDVSIQESSVKLDEVVVRVIKNKGEAFNDMSIISSRSISVEETKRYAGAFDDPSHVLSNYSGVANSRDGSSDIIVRGNSPKYMQWRLDGVEISSPYHFGDPIGGGNTLNNNLLAASDFYSGAFSAEYGNVLSSVFDVKLRPGNNEKFEGALGVGLLGTDLTLEGPFRKGYAGSYLINYRYSTVSLISDLGLVNVGGIPKYQDGTFKVLLPTKKTGTFSLFGVGGLSSYHLEDMRAQTRPTPGNTTRRSDLREDFNKRTHVLNIGLNHTLSINKKSLLKTSLSYSSIVIEDEGFESKVFTISNSEGDILSDSIADRKMNFDNRLLKSAYRGAITYSNKPNSKNKIQIGTVYTINDYNYYQSSLPRDSSQMFTSMDFKEKSLIVRNFISWKYRLNEEITIVAGVHNMNILLNNKSTLEPRIAINWHLNTTSSIFAGYGKHSNMESIHHYYAKVRLDNGRVVEPNKDLDLLKANHYALGYEKRFTKNLMAKLEVYYQDLYDLPVENIDTSFYATINEGFVFDFVDLVNKGTGKNYGVEFTLERFFDNHYYFLVNASLYESKYKSLEGIERNTRYNNNYLVNVLVGKELENLGKKNNQTLAFNAKVFFGGGIKYIPLLRDEKGDLAVDSKRNRYWDYGKAYDNKIDDIYQINLSLSYKWNKPKATHELFLDLPNLSNHLGKLYEYYDEDEPNSIGNVTQLIFFPNIMYRVYF